MRIRLVLLNLTAAALALTAVSAVASNPWSNAAADVIILGEYHDNPHHHHTQSVAVQDISPTAVVFEMLTPQEAAALADVPRNAIAAMSAEIAGFHWSNIADYADILSHSTVIVGAGLPREDMRAAFTDGAASVFGAQAGLYGLTAPLKQVEQTLRQELQFDAHCAAMPLEMMGGMVEAQRLRDASFARTVIETIDTFGAPVVLITGNGHARADWGVPVYLAQVRPELDVLSIGQGEANRAPPGVFSAMISDAPAPERPDPCAVFQTGN